MKNCRISLLIFTDTLCNTGILCITPAKRGTVYWISLRPVIWYDLGLGHMVFRSFAWYLISFRQSTAEQGLRQLYSKHAIKRPMLSLFYMTRPSPHHKTKCVVQFFQELSQLENWHWTPCKKCSFPSTCYPSVLNCHSPIFHVYLPPSFTATNKH